MKTRITIALLLLLVLAGTSSAQNAICPPVKANSGVTSSTVPPFTGGVPADCDYGFTVGTTMMILQGPTNRHFFKITNTSGGNLTLGICFARLELGVNACTIANAGTLLTPGQSFYQGVAMYGGINPTFNSIFFNGSIELIGSGDGVTVSATID